MGLLQKKEHHPPRTVPVAVDYFYKLAECTGRGQFFQMKKSMAC